MSINQGKALSSTCFVDSFVMQKLILEWLGFIPGSHFRLSCGYMSVCYAELY